MEKTQKIPLKRSKHPLIGSLMSRVGLWHRVKRTAGFTQKVDAIKARLSTLSLGPVCYATQKMVLKGSMFLVLAGGSVSACDESILSAIKHTANMIPQLYNNLMVPLNDYQQFWGACQNNTHTNLQSLRVNVKFTLSSTNSVYTASLTLNQWQQLHDLARDVLPSVETYLRSRCNHIMFVYWEHQISSNDICREEHESRGRALMTHVRENMTPVVMSQDEHKEKMIAAFQRMFGPKVVPRDKDFAA